jgi:hypothetical protein
LAFFVFTSVDFLFAVEAGGVGNSGEKEATTTTNSKWDREKARERGCESGVMAEFWGRRERCWLLLTFLLAGCHGVISEVKEREETSRWSDERAERAQRVRDRRADGDQSRSAMLLSQWRVNAMMVRWLRVRVGVSTSDEDETVMTCSNRWTSRGEKGAEKSKEEGRVAGQKGSQPSRGLDWIPEPREGKPSSVDQVEERGERGRARRHGTNTDSFNQFSARRSVRSTMRCVGCGTVICFYAPFIDNSMANHHPQLPFYFLSSYRMPNRLPTLIELPSAFAPFDDGFTFIPRINWDLEAEEAVGVREGGVKKEETGDREGGEEAEAGREESGEEEGDGECVWAG